MLPDLAFIRLAAFEESGRLLGHRVLPVVGLRPGYRHISLRNESGQPQGLSTLFVKVCRSGRTRRHAMLSACWNFGMFDRLFCCLLRLRRLTDLVPAAADQTLLLGSDCTLLSIRVIMLYLYKNHRLHVLYLPNVFYNEHIPNLRLRPVCQSVCRADRLTHRASGHWAIFGSRLWSQGTDNR